MFSVPEQLLDLQWKVSPGGRRAEAQRQRNRMEHEVTLKASKPTAPQTAGTANSLSKHPVNTSQGGGVMTNLNFNTFFFIVSS